MMYRYLPIISMIYLTYLYIISSELYNHTSIYNNTIIIDDYPEDNINTTILYYLIIILYLLSLL